MAHRSRAISIKYGTFGSLDQTLSGFWLREHLFPLRVAASEATLAYNAICNNICKSACVLICLLKAVGFHSFTASIKIDEVQYSIVLS